MPRYHTAHLGDCDLRLVATKGDPLRRFIRIFPYFWDNDFVLDVRIRPRDRKTYIGEEWAFSWEVRNAETGQSIKMVEKTSLISRATLLLERLWGWKYAARRAVDLGMLGSNEYHLYMRVKRPDLPISDSSLIASFTTKDRDELYMQTVIVLVSAAIGAGLALLTVVATGGHL